MSELGGRWVTINGVHVFIRDGETPREAVERQLGRDLESGTFTNGGKDIPYQEVDAQTFKDALDAAKNDVPEELAWRVDSTRAVSDWKSLKDEGTKTYVLGNGSTVAIKADGDIIAVCASASDRAAVRGKDLIDFAVAHGGRKLDCYSGLYGFYIKCGFHPVSWTPWNGDYAPPGWKKGYNEEHVLFFAHGNVESAPKTEREFRLTGPRFDGESGYEDAEHYRDAHM